jgi:hypothetical protein
MNSDSESENSDSEYEEYEEHVYDLSYELMECCDKNYMKHNKLDIVTLVKLIKRMKGSEESLKPVSAKETTTGWTGV